MIKAPAALALALTLAVPAGAAECRLALLLGLDISSSVDADEDALQRGGMVSAMLSDPVKEAFFASPTPVALGVFEWSGRYNQEIILDWTLIDTPQALESAVRSIWRSKRSYNEFPTAMGEALIFAGDMLRRAPDCWQHTIDIAGDGENNEGPRPLEVYASDPIFDKVTVNGLVVVNAADFQTPHRLTQFYQQEVLHGPGAFMVEANGFRDYERAIQMKLERELRATVVGGAPSPREPKG